MAWVPRVFRWVSGVGMVALVLLGQATLTSAAQRVVITVNSDGTVSAPDQILLPACPGESITFVFAFINGTANPSADSLDVSLPPGMSLVPGSCSADVGMCSVPDSSTVQWSDTVPAHGSATISFRVVILPGVDIGSQLCMQFTTTVGSGSPTPSEFCFLIQPCGVSAPAVGRFGATTLAVLLVVAGWMLARRRAA